MRILFVLEHYYPYLGGAEKLFQQLAEALATKGYEVRVVTTQFRADLPVEELVNGVSIKRVRCYSRFLFTLLSLPAAYRWSRGVNLIFTTTYNAALPAWIIGRFRQTRVLIVFHEYWGKLWFKLPFLTTLQRYLFYTYERVISWLPFEGYIAVSNATKNSLAQAGILPERIHRIYNGLNYHQFEPYNHQPGGTFTGIYYGRLGVSKGLDLIIPAWSNFLKEHPEAKLQLVIPTYPKRFFEKIMDLIHSYQIAGSVELLHEIPKEELYEQVSRAHVVLIPSYSEGFCFTAAEAVAIGTPIISSGKGALSEVVSGKYLVMNQHDTQSLTECLKLAYKQQWLDSSVKEFPFREAIEHYIRLLEKYQ